VQQKYLYIYLPDSLFVLFFNFKAHMVSWTHVRLLETPYVMVGVLVFFLDGAPDIYDIEIVCSLQADLETDEVYAQMTLIPTSNSVSVG
jgi:hypothetical protein